MVSYKILSKQEFRGDSYAIVPIRYEDRNLIMKWRNEQIYHLRQDKPLTLEQQDKYFNEVVMPLFGADHPNQLLFSYLKGEECIGYGGLVHINWIDRNAELSFIMDTQLERAEFELHWTNYLNLIEQVAFNELGLHKITTYAFDLRPHLYNVLEKVGYEKEAILKEHCFFDGQFLDVVIHCKIDQFKLRKATLSDEKITFEWANSPKIRQFSFEHKYIPLANHIVWFNHKLTHANCLYLILENSLNIPLGSIRLDVSGHVAEISYLIDPIFHRRGLGKTILNLCEDFIMTNNSMITVLEGYVLPENVASVKIFKGLHYLEEHVDKGLKFSKRLYENR